MSLSPLAGKPAPREMLYGIGGIVGPAAPTWIDRFHKTGQSWRRRALMEAHNEPDFT